MGSMKVVMYPVLILFSVILLTTYVALEELLPENHYTNDFAVEIDGDPTVADLVAGTHGFKIARHFANLGNVYHFIHDKVDKRSRRSSDGVISKLTQDPNVLRVEQQQILNRDKRYIIHDKQREFPIKESRDKSIYQRFYDSHSRISTRDEIPGANVDDLKDFDFNDPYFSDQWYLVNYGQTGGTVGYDINVLPVWKQGITGRGVVVSILDDGIDHTHPDLKVNYDINASADLNDKGDIHNDPMPNSTDPTNSHGTRCAGEVAAQANNSNCCVGIAHNARIGGVRMLDGAVTDLLEAEAVTYNNQYIDIYSASWGPTDDGKTMEGPHHYCKMALEEGVTKGRNGKGSIFVWATGNGGLVGDDCSCDGYVSSIYTLSVGCISDKGLSTYFSEVCPSTMAVVFTGGSHEVPGHVNYNPPKVKVVTTDLHGDCTLEFQGTSSAAPLAAGCIALVLETNSELTWRDIQHIVVETARIPNDEEDGWMVNGGGYHVNHRFGFGALNCGRMVEVAKRWRNVQEQHRCKVVSKNPPLDINSNSDFFQTLVTDGCKNDLSSSVDLLEHVQIYVQIEHHHRGDISIMLVSPSGTQSKILSQRPLDDSRNGIDFTFMTVHNWGENPVGVWTLIIKDNSFAAHKLLSGRGRLLSWSLVLYGVKGELQNQRISEMESSSSPVTNSEYSKHIGKIEVKHLMAEEVASADLPVKNEESLQQQKYQQSLDKTSSTQVTSLQVQNNDLDFIHKLLLAETPKSAGHDKSQSYKRYYPVSNLKTNKDERNIDLDALQEIVKEIKYLLDDK